MGAGGDEALEFVELRMIGPTVLGSDPSAALDTPLVRTNNGKAFVLVPETASAGQDVVRRVDQHVAR